jgi:hypothetical protein
MVSLMGENLNDGEITDNDLATYTAFFNPKWDNEFNELDWQKINREPENFYNYYMRYINTTVEIVAGHRVVRWWDNKDDLASGYCAGCKDVYTVHIPLEHKDLYFGYDPVTD